MNTYTERIEYTEKSNVVKHGKAAHRLLKHIDISKALTQKKEPADITRYHTISPFRQKCLFKDSQYSFEGLNPYLRIVERRYGGYPPTL